MQKTAECGTIIRWSQTPQERKVFGEGVERGQFCKGSSHLRKEKILRRLQKKLKMKTN